MNHRKIRITVPVILLVIVFLFLNGNPAVCAETDKPLPQSEQMPENTAAPGSPAPLPDTPAAVPDIPAALSDASDDMTLETLKTLIFSRQELRESIKVKMHARTIARSQEEVAALTKEIADLNKQLLKVENDLALVAAGVSPEVFSEKNGEKFDWRDEVQSLLAPMVHQLKSVTKRPRQIETLRGEIDLYEKQMETVKTALENLEMLSEKTGEKEVRVGRELEQIREFWLEKEKQLNDALQVSRFQLNDLLKEKESFWATGQNIMQSFFKSRGRNLLFAITAFFSCFFLMRFLYRQIYKYSPVHNSGERTVIMRLSDVIAHFLTFTVSIAAVIFALYISGDWLLLSFAIIFLLGIAWTAREGIPLFWKQIQMMLNLGTVRENERIVYNGVPWRVVSISLFVTLENQDLRPSQFRLPIREIIGMNSRPFHKNEPWFPCRVGEWVILSDGTRGEVLSQSPEMVQLGLRGGAKKTYQTPDFLGNSPLNISANFRLKVVFGFDYEHQNIITGEIPAELTKALRKGLAHKGFGSDILQLKTEVEAAGASSLDLVIIADFDGRVAALYNALKRIIQHYTIETCTEKGWGIPFPQITVHTPDVLKTQAHQTTP